MRPEVSPPRKGWGTNSAQARTFRGVFPASLVAESVIPSAVEGSAFALQSEILNFQFQMCDLQLEIRPLSAVGAVYASRLLGRGAA